MSEAVVNVITTGTERARPDRRLDIETLANETTGRFRVATATAAYQIDLDQMTLVRVPNDRGDPGAQLRRDGEPVSLEQAAWVVVGYPMILLINLGVPGVDVTTRISTAVVSIARDAVDGGASK